MAVAVGPVEELRAQLEDAIVQPGLTPEDRLAKLRAIRDDLIDLIGTAETYMADLEFEREGRYAEVQETLAEARSNADLRETLVARGMASEDDLTALGYLSHDELDRLHEEGRLLEALGGLKKWMERLHPRSRTGQFADKPGSIPNLPKGRGGGGTPKVLHTHAEAPAKMRRDRQAAKEAEELAGKAESVKKLDKNLSKHQGKSFPIGKDGEAQVTGEPGDEPDEQMVKFVKVPSDAEFAEYDNGDTISMPKEEVIAAIRAKEAEEAAALEGEAPEAEVPGEAKTNVDDLDEAVRKLAAGEQVDFEQPREVATLLDRLNAEVKKAVEAGEHAPNFNLCNVSVKGTNVFCHKSQGIPRAQMPQLAGKVVPGSPASKMDDGGKGWVDLSPNFVDHLKGKGYTVESGTELASYLRASQGEIDGVKVAKTYNRLAGNPTSGETKNTPIVISRDGYIVDGHHRWAALVGLDWTDGVGDITVPIERVDANIIDILNEANSYTKQQGIAQKKGREGRVTLEPPFEPVLLRPIVPDLYQADWITDEKGYTAEDEAAVQANLKKVDEIGLNEWPEHGEVASKLFEGLPKKDSGLLADTESKYTTMVPGDPDPIQEWTPERHELHEKILDILLRKRDGETLNQHGEPLTPAGKKRVLFMGGGSASGKSSALKLEENADVQPENSVIIDPDEIKAMLPEYHAMVEGGDRFAASGVHEESSYLSKRLTARAMEMGLNVVVDGTGDSIIKEKEGMTPQQLEKVRNKLRDKMRPFKADGYEVSAFYVNAPTDVALVRATVRAQETGRWVPKPEIENIHQGVSQRFEAEVLAGIEEGLIADIRGYDTAGRPPTKMFHLDENGKFVVVDQETYDSFIAKGKGKGT